MLLEMADLDMPWQKKNLLYVKLLYLYSGDSCLDLYKNKCDIILKQNFPL